MNRSTFRVIKYMNGSVFSKARYMNGVGFEIRARTPIPLLPLSTKKCLIEAILMYIHNIWFHREIRKLFTCYPLLSGAMGRFALIYFISTFQMHSIPLSGIPCLQYRREKEKEEMEATKPSRSDSSEPVQVNGEQEQSQSKSPQRDTAEQVQVIGEQEQNQSIKREPDNPQSTSGNQGESRRFSLCSFGNVNVKGLDKALLLLNRKYSAQLFKVSLA